MRASSGLVAGLALVLMAAAAADVSAHRREDYLQAARIGVEPDHVVITLDLTPGAAVAEPFLAALDRDGDGALSRDEQHAYAAQVISALEVEVDQRPLQPRLVASRVAEPPAFRHGDGTMRLTLDAALPTSAGSHELLFRNTHLAEHSAYLANALVPESDRVTVKAQRRDRDQTEITIEYTVRGDAPAPLAWVLGTLAAAVVLVRSKSFSLP